MEYVYDFPYRIKYYETDKMGFVHNSNYFRYFEIARVETMRSMGLPYDDIEKKGVIMPLVEQYARYHKPTYYDEVVILRTTIKEIPLARINFEYKVIRKQDDGKEVLLCEGKNSICFTEGQTRKAIRCPQWIKEKVEKEKKKK